MSACLSIDVDNVVDVLKSFDAIKVYRSVAQNGTYLEVTAPNTRLPLQASVTHYSYSDADGSSSSWYATSYWNGATRLESSRSPPVQADGDGTEPLISIADLKQNYLFGLQLTDRQGAPLPEGVFLTGIRAGTAWIARRIGLQLTPIEVLDERHDVRLTTSAVLPLCTVDVLPVRQVRAVRLQYPGMQVDPYDFSPEHLNVSTLDGRVEGTAAYGSWPWAGQGSNGGSLGFGYNRNGWQQASVALYGSKRAAGALRIDYAAGFTKDTLPADILDLVAKAACLQPLAIAGDMQQPNFGVSSSSIGFDGLSQSVSRSGNAYATRIAAYQAQIEAESARIRSYYRSLQLRVV